MTNEFEEKRSILAESVRGTYIIMPLKYSGEADIKCLQLEDADEIGFDSESMSDLIRHRCGNEQGFVRRFHLKNQGLQACFADGYALPVEDVQLAVFENGIGFLILFFHVSDKEINRVYGFINPGYLQDKDENIQQNFIDDIKMKILHGTGFEIYVEGEDKKLAIKESYLMNTAFTDCRYNSLETLNRVTFNAHKLIGLGEDFEDKSEKDIAYTYGARDVENKTFRWGCCISSQSISFVYGPGNANYNTEKHRSKQSVSQMTAKEMSVMAEDDLLLTVLALYQKYTCMMLNEKVYYHMRENRGTKKEIQKIKSEMLVFKAYGTIPPSQISRWNNVCETYRYLLELNGVGEAIGEIADNIELVNEERERIGARRQSYFATILAVFGMVSIVAAVLQIVDYVEPGDPVMLLWTVISCIGLLLFGIAWVVMLWRKRD